jgi:hypothetical protein
LPGGGSANAAGAKAVATTIAIAGTLLQIALRRHASQFCVSMPVLSGVVSAEQ